MDCALIKTCEVFNDRLSAPPTSPRHQKPFAAFSIGLKVYCPLAWRCGNCCHFVFSLLTSWGFWNEWRGDNSLLEVAARFDKSFTTDASSPVRPSDPAWLPLMRVIRKYSHADFRLIGNRSFLPAPKRSSPRKITTRVRNGQPQPPYRAHLQRVARTRRRAARRLADRCTIEDLHNWIRNDEADFDFRVRTYIFNVLTLCVGVFLALPEKPKRPRNSDSDEPPARA